jgi:HSP20 family protein
MANIMKRPSDGNQPAELDPFRVMREMLRWDPFREMAPIFSGLERNAYMPHFDVTENKDSYLFKADVPGVKDGDIDITLNGRQLQISGKRDVENEQKNDTYYTYERQFGTFTRTFTLPDTADCDHAKSELKDGVLTLVIPKKAEAQAKKIPVSASGQKS